MARREAERVILTAPPNASGKSVGIAREPGSACDAPPESEYLRGEQAAAASRQHLAAAAESLRTMDPAAPGAARDVALAELAAAARRQDAFLHAAAHDLRNPLAALRGQAQLLGRRARRVDSGGVEAARVREAAVAIEEAADRTARLIDRLLDAGWKGAESGAEEEPPAGR